MTALIGVPTFLTVVRSRGREPLSSHPLPYYPDHDLLDRLVRDDRSLAAGLRAQRLSIGAGAVRIGNGAGPRACPGALIGLSAPAAMPVHAAARGNWPVA